MKLKDALKLMFFLACVVTTFQILFIATYVMISGADFTLRAAELYRVCFIGFSCVLPVLLFVRNETARRAEIIVRKALHFFLTAGIVFGLLIYYQWMDTKNALFIALFFLALYFSALAFGEIRQKRLADKINERINAFHDTENASHKDGH